MKERKVEFLIDRIKSTRRKYLRQLSKKGFPTGLWGGASEDKSQFRVWKPGLSS